MSTMITLNKITQAEHESAVEWIACAFEGQATDHLSRSKVIRVIENWYDGGLDQFKADVAYMPF